ncbi:MAG: nitroreductase family protein [Eubacteriales bacterium]|nr:nitroreductase family protein [Eubacteriales bacterium]
MKSVMDVIKKRKSIRTYEDKKLSEDDCIKIREYINTKANRIGPSGKEIRLELIFADDNESGKGLKIGTYGIIVNPQAYIAGCVSNTPEDMVEFGYVMEKMILFLTNLGLGTCWLGGTFDRKTLNTEIIMEDGQIIPSITPVGYPKNREGIKQRAMRLLVKADQRLSWKDLFFLADFSHPMSPKMKGILNEPLEMVRLGPSASNKQPWRILISEDKSVYAFYLKRTPNYAGNAMGFDMQRIDMGIAICHFQISCDEMEVKGEWFIDQSKENIDSMEYISSFRLA